MTDVAEVGATPAELASRSVLERNPDVAWQRVGGELVLLQCRTRRLLGLNLTAARCWELLDGNRTLGLIAACLAGEFSAPVDATTADVIRLATALTERDLVRAKRHGDSPQGG